MPATLGMCATPEFPYRSIPTLFDSLTFDGAPSQLASTPQADIILHRLRLRRPVFSRRG
jgi:hypothetical protein